MRFFFGQIQDNLVLIPTLVLSWGRDPQTHQVGACQILVSWLNLEVGLELDFYV